MTRRLIKIALFGVAFYAALLIGTHNAHSANWPDPRLDTVAAEVAGHPVAVFCEDSWLPWESFWLKYGQDGTFVGGFTFLNTPTVYLSPLVCETLHAILTQGPRVVGSYYASLAVHTLIHEAVHQRGISDEGVTDCTALTLDRDVAVRSFGYSLTDVEGYYKRVVRKVRGKRTVRWVHAERTVPSALLAEFYAFAVAWHHARPVAYQGPCG